MEASGQAIYNLVTASDPGQRHVFFHQVENLEHLGDEMTHELFNELGQNFITPFDREDIYRLASAVDDIVDFIHGAAKRIELYRVTEFSPEIIKLADYVRLSTIQVSIAVHSLRTIHRSKSIHQALMEINNIENHADDIFDHAVAKLFENKMDAIELIKMKEVLTALETATDKCEDAANVIESIYVKMA